MMIPYGRQTIEEDDIRAVVEALRSDWLTTGPLVEVFENKFANFVGARHAVAVSNGTAALHASMYALNIQPGDEVIVSPMTFAASANCVVFQGGTPVFADVDKDTLLIDPAKVEEKITKRTKAIVAVDYAGQPCEYDALNSLAKKHGLKVVGDACHALGGSYKGKMVGSLADLSAFSLHPVKHITTGEGGVITTDDPDFAARMKMFRSHGISSDHRQREKEGSWFYEMMDLGYNYRLTDFQCALGISQLAKLPNWIHRRQSIAKIYDQAFSKVEGIKPLGLRSNLSHAYHLYVVRIEEKTIGKDRATVFKLLRSKGIGVNVHYVPVHLHPYYRKRFGTEIGQCPVAEAAYNQILSLPMFPRLEDSDVNRVISIVNEVIS